MSTRALRIGATFFSLSMSLSLSLFSCKNNAGTDAQTGSLDQRTPVTTAQGVNATIKDTIVLNAVSTYLQTEEIKSDMNGYIKAIHSSPGDKVSRGQALFTMQTKESKNIGNIINQLDSSYRFSGISHIKSPVSGFVTELNHQAGDYVQQGELLARMSDASSFGFVLHIPFESHTLISLGRSLTIHLPDGSFLTGYIAKILPQLDSASQTQQVFIKLRSMSKNIPSQLMASVVLTSSSFTGFSLPKACVYTDELKQEFWVLQVIGDTMVRKVPVSIGMENDSLTAIIAPLFSLNDRFVEQGGYGLEDAASIKITAHE